MPAGSSFSCQGCGLHAFQEPRLCYWCQNPLDEVTRAARVADGIVQAQVSKGQVPMDQWEAERQRLHAGRRSLVRDPPTESVTEGEGGQMSNGY